MTDPRSVVEKLTEAINDRDVAGSRALFAPSARLVAATGRVLDIDGMTRLVQSTVDAFPDLRFSIDRWAVEGDMVMTEELMEGTHNGPFAGIEPTGKRVTLAMVHVTRVTAGKIVERVAYHDTAGILRQITG